MEEKDPVIENFRLELKELYINLYRLKRENPELYADIIEDIMNKVKDVKHRMAMYKMELVMDENPKGGR